MSDKPKYNIDGDLLNDSMIIAGGSGIDTYTITLDNSEYSYDSTYLSSGNTITLTSSNAGVVGPAYTMGNITINNDTSYSNFNWGNPEEWVDSFPEWQRVQDMCKKYPALEIALRNFRTIYTLVKDDYDNPKDKK